MLSKASVQKLVLFTSDHYAPPRAFNCVTVPEPFPLASSVCLFRTPPLLKSFVDNISNRFLNCLLICVVGYPKHEPNFGVLGNRLHDTRPCYNPKFLFVSQLLSIFVSIKTVKRLIASSSRTSFRHGRAIPYRLKLTQHT